MTGFGADNVMTSLISDDAQIGLMGSESSIYVYAQGASDYAVNFAQLTQRAGNFLVSRTAEDDFHGKTCAENDSWRQGRWYATDAFGIYFRKERTD